jgi:hypothetical protein
MAGHATQLYPWIALSLSKGTAPAVPIEQVVPPTRHHRLAIGGLWQVGQIMGSPTESTAIT